MLINTLQTASRKQLEVVFQRGAGRFEHASFRFRFGATGPAGLVMLRISSVPVAPAAAAWHQQSSKQCSVASKAGEPQSLAQN